MRYLLLYLLLVGNSCLGQTQEHVKIPGTKCRIIPPAGFVLSSNFNGFENEIKNSTIIVNDFPVGSYHALLGVYTEKNLKEKGIVLTGKKTINFGNNEATVIEASQKTEDVTYIQQTLIFENENATFLVMGVYTSDFDLVKDEITKSIFSIECDSVRQDSPLDAVDFTIDVTGTNFEFVMLLSGAIVYTVDGKYPTKEPALIVKQLPAIEYGDKQEFVVKELKSSPLGEFIVIKDINSVTIDNLNGYEIIAYRKAQSGQNELVYQVVLFDKKYYYTINMQAIENLQDNLTMFRKIAKAFSRK